MKRLFTVVFGLSLAAMMSAAVAEQVAINFNPYVAGAPVDDTAGGGLYWTTITHTNLSDYTTVYPLKSVDGTDSDFDIRSNHYIRLNSAGNAVTNSTTLDGVVLPGSVTSRGYGGIGQSEGNALNQWEIRVPVASGLDSWTIQLFAGEIRNGGLSPIAANIGGTFSWDAPSLTGDFAGGVTVTFTGPADDPDGDVGVDWLRSDRFDDVRPSIVNDGGTDYYSVLLQFADMGRYVAETEDYSTLVGIVVTGVHIPEPGMLGLVGLGFACVAGRRHRRR